MIFEQPTPSCSICHEVGSVTLTEDQVKRYDKWQRREGYIQNLLGDLSADLREQLMSGTHPDCWNSRFVAEECAIDCDGSAHPGLWCK